MNQALIENSGPDPSTPALLYASIPSRLLSIVLRIAGWVLEPIAVPALKSDTNVGVGHNELW